MADLASIVKDPNFVNANAATKKAIFDKWAPQDPNYANANAATQQAIQQKFGVVSSDAEIPQGLQPSVPIAQQPEPELTTGQKIYSAVRPYAAPILEVGGAITGGLLGATAGTFGAGPVGTATGGVAGAGLGYGIVKEAEEMADVAMGMKKPRQGAEQVTEPVRNVLEGGALEAGGRGIVAPVIGAVGKAVGKAVDLAKPSVNKAVQIVRNALGPDLPEVANALRAAKGTGVSAAQATAHINSPTWQALVDRASRRDPRAANALMTLQDEASLNTLSKLAGGTTATETRAAGEAAKETLTKATEPARQMALTRANLGKNLAEFEAAVKGAPTSDQIAQLNNVAADNLRAAGIKPLDSKALVEKIRAVADKPEYGGLDVVPAAVRRVSDQIAKWTSQQGAVDANALYAIRKNAVKAVIERMRPGIDASSKKNLESSVLSEISPLIDDAIEQAGGKGWGKYLKDYSAGMRQISENKLKGEALKLWKTNKDEFVRLVQNESPETVEKILGSGNYNIAKELSDDTMATLRSEAEKVVRNANIKSQVAGGQDALKELLLQNMSKLRIPSYMSAVGTTTNKALNILEERIGRKTMETLTEALKTPEGASKLLETLPSAERSRVLKLLSDPSKWGTGGRAAATAATVQAKNMMTPDRYNQNTIVEQPRTIDTGR